MRSRQGEALPHGQQRLKCVTCQDLLSWNSALANRATAKSLESAWLGCGTELGCTGEAESPWVCTAAVPLQQMVTGVTPSFLAMFLFIG